MFEEDVPKYRTPEGLLAPELAQRVEQRGRQALPYLVGHYKGRRVQWGAKEVAVQYLPFLACHKRVADLCHDGQVSKVPQRMDKEV